jgi:hypothetical protein
MSFCVVQTRWLSLFSSLKKVIASIGPIMNFLQQETVDRSSTVLVQQKAEDLLRRMRDIKIHLALRAMFQLTQKLYMLSLTLQGREITIEGAMHAVQVRGQHNHLTPLEE